MKRLTEAISNVVNATPSARSIGAGLLLKGLMASTAAHADTTVSADTSITSPADFDTAHSTSYIPASGADCLAGVQPHNLTGGLGFRGDQCAATLESTVDGNTFTDETSRVVSAINSAGYTPDGTVWGSCDYSAARDEWLVVDALASKLYVIEGMDSGSITSVTQLEGDASGCGSIDEATGAFLAPSDTGSQIEVAEFSASSAPVPFYGYGSNDTSGADVSTSLNQALFTNNDASAQVYFDSNISSGSTSSAVAIDDEDGNSSTKYVSPFGLFESSETGGDPVVLLGNGLSDSLDYATVINTAATVDPDADSDGEAASIDCDDTDATINSSADETCDGLDNNCDGATDGADSIDQLTWYRDADGDGAGDATSPIEACDVPAGYVDNDIDYDDSDPSVILEPVVEPDECDGEESAGGEFESGEPICGPDGMAVVWSGAVDYDDSLAITYMADAQDWLEFQDSLPMDSSTYNGLIVTPPVGSHGGYALAITDADMTAFLGAPPPSLGAQPATLRVDEGEEVLVENLIQGTSEYFGEGTHDLLEEGVVDADGDGVYDNVYNNPDEFPNDASESVDSDGDGEGDNGDSDDDNDGFSDNEEAEAGTNPYDDESHPVEDDTAGDTDDTDDTDEPDTDLPDTDEPGTDDSAGEGETPNDRQGSSCSAMTDLSLTSTSMPWVLTAAGLTVIGRRRSRSKERQAA